MSIITQFELQVRRAPDAVAVEFGDGALTYVALDERANRLSHYLQAQGVSRGTLVGLCMQPSSLMITALLGILKAGGAYVPLDPTYPEERLAYIAGDARLGVILTESALVRPYMASAAKVICVDTDWVRIARQPATVPPTPVMGEDAAYVIYTSGSTGRPKGVVVPHRGVVRLAEGGHYIKVEPSDRVAQVSNIAFDAATFEVWGALLNGATLVGIPRSAVLSPHELVNRLDEAGISVLLLTTAVFHQVGRVVPNGFRHLRCVLFGGEAVDPKWVRAVMEAGPPGRLVNAYGPTECTTFAACHVITTVPEQATSVPIGLPIARTQAYVLDSALRPCLAGEAGELYVGGDGLALGYLYRPELTAERFINDPFTAGANQRLYRTGDIARWLPDGTLDYVGRADDQVKVRGYRIELGEVEAVLKQHPAVLDALVDVREREPGDKRLVAYVMPQLGASPRARELRDWLKRQLPEPMIPSAIVAIEQLPLTPNGKVDRSALPMPDWARPELESAYTAPGTPLEQELAAIWAEVLGVERVGVNDPFFDLGGHSLKATQIAARVRERMGVDLPVLALFTHVTVGELAGEIARLHETGSRSSEPVIRPVPRDGWIPLSFSQEPVWFLQQLSPDLMSYNFQAVIQFQGQLQIPVLERSLSQIIRRHEIFRTTFELVGGRPGQVVHEPWGVLLPIVDLSAVAESDREAAAEQLIARELRKPFDVSRLPLIRWTLLRMGPEQCRLVHAEHHFVHDGWSFILFLRELNALYRAFAAGLEDPLEPPGIQFADYAAWQREWFAGEVAEQQLGYWKEKLQGVPPRLDLITDRPRPAVQRFRGTARRVSLPAHLVEGAQALSRQEGVTLFMTLLSVFQTLLYRYSGQEDFCVGSGLANRRWRALEGLMGMVVGTVALRADLSGNPTFRDLLARVRQVTLEAHAHSDIPFDRIVEALKPERSLSHLPIYQVAFSFHDTPVPKFELPGVAVSLTEGLSNGSAKFDLQIVAIPRPEEGTVTFVWEYNTDLFDADTIERMIGQYEQLLAGAIAEPNRPVRSMPLLTEDERRRLAHGPRPTAVGARALPPVHRLVEAQARQQRDALAVQGADSALTYGQLNGKANQLARFLRRLGVGPDALVGVCMERSGLTVLAQLAVLKAGGAYVAMDPAHPAEHLRFMIQDSGQKVLLTTQVVAERLGAVDAHVACLDSGWAPFDSEPDQDLADGPEPNHLAYVIYTSGSTGRPKGVLIEHRGLSNLVQWQHQAFAPGPSDRATLLAGVGFDASVLETWAYLAAGASLYVVPPAERLDLAHLRDWLDAQGITQCFLPTPLAEVFLTLDWAGYGGLRQMRYLLTGGDRLRQYPPAGLPFDLINLYGPTEDTVVATWAPILPTGDATAPPPIGRPLPNQHVYVLDFCTQPGTQAESCTVLPVGVPGELCIGGAGLARGYLNRPDVTEAAFVPHPFVAGERLYRTGDRVRLMADGALDFLGRLDQQVKVRGYRIEPDEIAVVLKQHPAVADAVVAVREERPGQVQLVGYIVPAPEGVATPAELSEYLKQRLPVYMVPSAFVALARLPLTPNGKVDRRALPAPQPSAEAEEEYAPPRTPVEEHVAAVWTEVLGVQRVSVHDSFFALGGHSLLTTKVALALRERVGLEIPVRLLFEATTVADLAAGILQMQLAQTSDADLEGLLLAMEQLAEEEV